ncbi:MAG: NUDIX domain-containing protein [Actinomycetota bacterium]|nr:NUDIX domain-containing protein [Actinomycetota bacterium]
MRLAYRERPAQAAALSCAPFAVFVVVVRQGYILLLRAPGSDAFQVPSGAVEADEDLTTAALRELRGASGEFEVSDLRCFSATKVAYDPLLPDLLSIGFVCRYRSGVVVPGDDMANSELRWVQADEAATMPLVVPSAPELLREAVAALR